MLTALQKTDEKILILPGHLKSLPNVRFFLPTPLTSEAINGAITGVGICYTPSLAPKGVRQL